MGMSKQERRAHRPADFEGMSHSAQARRKIRYGTKQLRKRSINEQISVPAKEKAERERMKKRIAKQQVRPSKAKKPRKRTTLEGRHGTLAHGGLQRRYQR